MREALSKFRNHVDYARNLGVIYSALNAQTTNVLDLSDILRAEIVMAVSAFDTYIHALVRKGMLEIYNESRPPTDAFHKFQIPLRSALNALDDSDDDEWLNQIILEKHSWLTFQQPDKVADAIRLVSDVGLWVSVSRKLNLPPDDLKRRLQLIVERRNQIAHEADCDPTFPDERWPIDVQMVTEALDFICGLAEAINQVLA